MLLPCAQKLGAVSLEVAHNIADFMGGKPGIDGQSHVVKPKFGLFGQQALFDYRQDSLHAFDPLSRRMLPQAEKLVI